MGVQIQLANTEISGMVSTIQRFSLGDGPGIRTTVFLKGCQLKCPWCHNPESISRTPELYFRASKCIGCGKCLEVCPVDGAVDFSSPERINREICIKCMKCAKSCPSGALEAVGRVLTVAQVLDEVLKDKIFYDTSGGGVTFSGGEATIQISFLAALLAECKTSGIHTCLESNGMAGKTYWDRIIPNLDLLYLDIKHMDPDLHEKVCGVSNQLVLANARELSSQVKTVIRVPLIPGFNDNEGFIEELGSFLQNIPEIQECHLIPYHDYGNSKYTLLGRKDDIYRIPYPLGEKPKHYKEILERYGLGVTIVK